MMYLGQVVSDAIGWAKSGAALARKAQRRTGRDQWDEHYRLLIEAAEQWELAARRVRSYVEQMQRPD